MQHACIVSDNQQPWSRMISATSQTSVERGTSLGETNYVSKGYACFVKSPHMW